MCVTAALLSITAPEITAGKASGATSGGTITPDGLIPKLRALAKDKKIAGEEGRVEGCCGVVLPCVGARTCMHTGVRIPQSGAASCEES